MTGDRTRSHGGSGRIWSTDRRDRAQSNVVGVALLLAITVIALGGLTAGVGTLVSDHARSADAARVADGFDSALRPVETTGTHRGRVEFTEGRLRTVERDLRVLSGGSSRTIHVDALVYESGDRRVTFLAGAVIRGTGDNSRLYREPPITASRGSGGVLVVGAPTLGAGGVARSGSGLVETTLRTNVTHDRNDLGRDTYSIAIETETPRAWRVAFDRLGATVVDTDRDVDGDGVTSVVAEFPGTRRAYLVIHEMRLEVTR